MILVHILSQFQHLKVMISTARPLGQEVELERYESAVLPVMLDGHPLHIHSMGIRDAHHSYQVPGPVHDLADM